MVFIQIAIYLSVRLKINARVELRWPTTKLLLSTLLPKSPTAKKYSSHYTVGFRYASKTALAINLCATRGAGLNPNLTRLHWISVSKTVAINAYSKPIDSASTLLPLLVLTRENYLSRQQFVIRILLLPPFFYQQWKLFTTDRSCLSHFWLADERIFDLMKK